MRSTNRGRQEHMRKVSIVFRPRRIAGASVHGPEFRRHANPVVLTRRITSHRAHDAREQLGVF